jgi:HTH-type transcriptional regulator / antitoxin HipB
MTAMAVKIDIESIRSFGGIVRFHRKEAGLSRADLAAIAGVGKTVIYDIENGKETVRLNTLLKVLAVLNIRVSLDSPIMNRYEADPHA